MAVHPPRARAIAALALAIGAAGCGAPALTSYDLSPVEVRGVRATAPLRIAEPIALIDLDSDRILVRAPDRTLAVLPGARWAERLPLLLRARLYESFENAGLAKSVASDGGGATTYELDLDIRSFELVVAEDAVQIDIAAKVVALASGRAVAAEIFTDSEPVATSGAGEVTAALDRSLSRVLPRIVAFAARLG